MPENLDNKGLKSIVEKYDLFFIDIWGVIHNGVHLFEKSIKCLDELDELGKKYILLTNAPRPNTTVINFLKNMGLENNKCEKVFTSGQAALSYLNKTCKDLKFFHVGPARDFDLFKSLEKKKVEDIKDSDFLLCTGLFEDYEKDLSYYKNLFKNEISKKMICTNPDLIVDREEKREFCAGSVAKEFELIGGKVDYFGKPYSLVYSQSAEIKNKNVLCIGDNLNTDIRGANNQKFDSLLILNGVHRNEFNNDLEKLLSRYDVQLNYTQSQLEW